MKNKISHLTELAQHTDYSLLKNLTRDPAATPDGNDHRLRQVFSGHYVPVTPTPINEPIYVTHSKAFFEELGFDDALAYTEEFKRLFSGDMSQLPEPMTPYGWATGYALSIYGTEYVQQCPFQTGNGYGDGRAISVVEGLFNDKRWEMQLKGSGPTPYCRGADGRAVLRSSVREFLAQEHMFALGISTSRALSLFMSPNEQVNRPWYYEGSKSDEPDVMLPNPVAIATRAAPSFLRVGQIELFARRARSQEHPAAQVELETIVLHLIDREYGNEVSPELSLPEKVILLASLFKERLTTLMANWLRVGYCQGNFNSDNCAAGGFTLDYGPFGFCERFDPVYQPWTGGGRHFSYFNQPLAAEKNFGMFCSSLEHLLTDNTDALNRLQKIRSSFSQVMEQKLEQMWADKLGLTYYNSEVLVQLLQLMIKTSVDFNMFFRELSHIPKDCSALAKSFYKAVDDDLMSEWQQWYATWSALVSQQGELNSIRSKMKKVNPKYTWREWLVVPAYQQAAQGDFSLIKELQEVLNNPYDEQSTETEQKYYQLRPEQYHWQGGVSHYSCSS
ncbi:MAG: YdiU family protein [Gammaproteobacteria bacterium]|nr:YdiU family protein [Gammaproteobacteria bacterium]